MLTELKTDRYTLRGASLGGMYTSIQVPELDAVFDVGVALRGGCSTKHLFLSHAHADHLGALPAFLGMRGLSGVKTPLKVFLPEGLEGPLQDSLDHFGRMHRWPLKIEAIPMAPGDEVELRRGLFVRAFKTFHPVPSLGYLFIQRVNKLKPEFGHLPGAEIGRLRKSGADIFVQHDHLELAYATDTLPSVLDQTPELFKVRTLIMECTFLDDRKSVANARAGCHIHLDELLPYADKFENESIVLMHFSQLYKPTEVLQILAERCPPEFHARLKPLVPDAARWWN